MFFLNHRSGHPRLPLKIKTREEYVLRGPCEAERPWVKARGFDGKFSEPCVARASVRNFPGILPKEAKSSEGGRATPSAGGESPARWAEVGLTSAGILASRAKHVQALRNAPGFADGSETTIAVPSKIYSERII